MKYVNLGRTGLKVSNVCLGTMQFGWTADEPLSHKILSQAFEDGVTFIDTADVYSRWADDNPGGVAEQIIGRWLKNSSVQRDQVVIATKVRGMMGDGPNDKGLSRAHIISAVEASLQRLQTDYIDLYQSHAYDNETPIDETLHAYDDLIHQGKVRYIGASNYPAWRLMESLWASAELNIARYDSLQPHYNIAYREEFERELQEVCEKYQIGVIPYSPLGGGFLTGKYQPDKDVSSARSGGVERRYFNPKGWETLKAVEETAKEYNASTSQIALAWLINQPVITSPIIGPRTLEQLSDNVAASEIELSMEDFENLDKSSDWESQSS